MRHHATNKMHQKHHHHHQTAAADYVCNRTTLCVQAHAGMCMHACTPDTKPTAADHTAQYSVIIQ